MKTWSIMLIACLFGRGYADEVDMGFMKNAKKVHGMYVNPAYRVSKEDGTGWKFEPEAFFSVSFSLLRTSLNMFPLFPDVSPTPQIEVWESEEETEEGDEEESGQEHDTQHNDI